ncbi:biotin/lipoyl-binding protein [Paraburkholderia sp. ZP32-5]|uniref:biotin/lipoyl-binding protein n=1 Tax=Paraburkholderia sp. ZP32-5 TaxID=2883245 RepID=UPI001F1722C3|nr:biotin/lipoyl-binding protein [Paraburkholderia sp. ZP32-5]
MNSIRVLAIGDLLRRYGAVWRTAWSIRDQLDTKPRLSHEIAFLPANLELVETPVHPVPRWTMRIIVLLALAILLIAIFGQLDIVAAAKGKLLPNARIKIIQPAITGVVRSILVQDGQRVAAGQVLMELDPTQAAADTDKARASKIDAELAISRAQGLLEAQSNGLAPAVHAVEGASPIQQRETQHFADGLYQEYRDKLHSAEAELFKRQAELETTREEIAKLADTAPLARQQANEYQALLAEKYVARTAGPPETGASIRISLASLARLANSCVIFGDNEEWSMISESLRPDAIIPFWPKTTSWISVLPGRHRKTASLSRTAIAVVSPTVAPQARASSVAQRSTSLTQTAWPLSIRRRASGMPSRPNPNWVTCAI